MSDILRLKLLIAYDGRPFRGWQSQATKDAVQDHVEAAFANTIGEKVSVQGSGRTDAGVHALAQIAHADVPTARLEVTAWQGALNNFLPPEIRVLRVTRAAPDFHARFSARGKIYTYRIWNSQYLHPLEIGRVWHMPSALDLDILRAGLVLLEGQHDFAGFAANRAPGYAAEDTVRTIQQITLSRRGELLTLRFEGNGFLYKMVRLLTGTLVRCAQGRAELTFIHELLAEKGARKTSFAAPAEGLYLTRVLY
ncbi:MAG: tRNA pseudouridine(38-40) synthase TruA [Chthoniobacter sp.]|uniref:tRNA pseudouridine(38-40) synthase TruA n=1 Tax=Chthoniobacter sp. TaxID=2510640 RepID=UPI0032A5D330